MKKSRYRVSRQKACQNCSQSKARCNRQNPQCGRCTKRDLTCVYPRSSSPALNNEPWPVSSSLISTNSHNITSGENSKDCWDLELPNQLEPNHSKDDPSSSVPNTSSHQNAIIRDECMDFSSLNLNCPIKINQLSVRWVDAFIMNHGKKIKNYSVGTLEFISRTLKSYAAAASRGSGLPFVHPTQMMEKQANLPLLTCLSLIRVCENPLPGSEITTSKILQQEMENIMEQYSNYENELSLLAAFQAYLIYFLVLYFRLTEGPNSISDDFRHQAMINLQTIAQASCERGLQCVKDRRRSRPRWEEWIVAEAKRRTLYLVYLLDSIIASRDNLPVFLGTELKGLSLPSSKYLWDASTRSNWEKLHNLFLAQWNDADPTIDELWPVTPEMTTTEIADRRSRVDRWLEDVDAFGMMLYAITVCTHAKEETMHKV